MHFFFCLCALAGFAQNSKPLDLKEIVSGEFIPQNISGVIPIPGDGEHYSQMNADKTQIIKYSFKTGKPVEVHVRLRLLPASVHSRSSTATALLRTAANCLLQQKQCLYTATLIQQYIIYIA